MQTLIFVSTRFLFPVDSGGKIRTTQILRGLKGGDFRVVLLSPATRELTEKHSDELEKVCDEFLWWPQRSRGKWFTYSRLRHFVGKLPIPVRTDLYETGKRLICDALSDRPSVAVFDFAHAAVLAPDEIPCPSVMFTHNVEAEIFRRHRDVSKNPINRFVWDNQYEKMQRFEGRILKLFDVVVAVAKRDAEQFVNDYDVTDPIIIPTGVDLDFFSFQPPIRSKDVVFCGSMDWLANQDGISYFLDEIWDLVVAQVPDARMTVVGRAPPERLIDAVKRRDIRWQFTGMVDDVRPYIQGSAVSVIPLRVGGGTRLKAYEAMAMGSPIVSTSIGMEGLNVRPGQHYLGADSAREFADAVVSLLLDDAARFHLARTARSYVENHFSFTVAAKAFENACRTAILRHRERTG